MKQFNLKTLKHIKSSTLIEKGWSFDKKYMIQTEDNTYIFRVAPIDKKEIKEKEYHIIETLYNKGITTHKPLEICVSDDKEEVGILLEYISGDQAEIVLPHLTKEKQYQLGYQMGQELKMIHSFEYKETSNWEETYTKKIEHRLSELEKCGFQSPVLDEIIQFVKDHMYLLKDRPTCLNHGDFHSGNMIITPDEEIYIIDYNRNKIGDPLYEFNRIFFSYSISPLFSTGILNGYFNDLVTEEHHLYIKFYLLSVVIGNIPWALQFDQKDVDFAKKSINDIYNTYNQLKSTIPNWYKNR